MFRKKDSVEKMRDLWNSYNKKSKFGFISFLQSGQKWDGAEFHIVGVRFVDRMMERFAEYGVVEPSYASILEIGCGVGRFLKPLACRFQNVCGVDISQNMLETARDYCSCLPNITFKLNDGKSLTGINDNSYDYCVSAGVFQHITDINVIISYIKEGLRIIKPQGLMLFQFVGNYTEEVGHDAVGAKITADLLDKGLIDSSFIIREVSVDPEDKLRCVVIVIQKIVGDKKTETFKNHKMIERRWLSKVYDDIKTKTHMHSIQIQPQSRLTFYDE
ncbi:MAG: class I SAM-dependent methyltransferase [Nitrospirae bacterium]|nr:class I SAM-dependent methyltransferase [Nitrospirota bacterium]MBF0541588.1 class I SAM-dependent methyltransferase [Nitrospirota bacterium]